MMTPLRSKEECGRLCRQAAPGRAAPASADQAGKQFAFAWHGSAAASLLDGWSTIPDDGVTAKQRGRRQPLSASSSFQCWPDRQTVCIRLAPQSSRTLARWFGRRDCKAKRKAARLCRQAAPASAGQAGKQFASDWHHRASARLLDDWSETSLMVQLQSKEEGGSLCRQAAPFSAGQTGKQFAIVSH